MDYFERSMHLRPNYTDAHLNLGRLYEEMGRRGRELEHKFTTQVTRRLMALAAGLSETSRAQLSKALTQLVLYDAEQSGVDLDPDLAHPAARSE